MKKRVVILIVLLVISCLLGGAYLMFGDAVRSVFQVMNAEPAVSQTELYREIVVVTRGDLEEAIHVLGTVHSPAHATLSFDVDQGQIAEVYARPGSRLRAGDPIAKLDTTDLDEAVRRARETLVEAQSALDDARQPYTELDLAEKRLAIQLSETRVKEAQEALDAVRELDADGLRADVESAQQNLESARLSYQLLQQEDVEVQVGPIEYRYGPAARTCAELWGKTNPGEQEIDLRWRVCNEAQDGADEIARLRLSHQKKLLEGAYQVRKAERVVTAAQQKLAEAAAGPDPLDVAKAEHALAEAQAKASAAHEALAEAETGPDSTLLSSKELAVERARIALENAEAALGHATLRAPMDGTVTLVPADVGDRISRSTTIAEMADLAGLRVEVDVDETEISQVKEGQMARLAFDGLLGQTFGGRVQAIPVQGTLVNGVLYYKVVIRLDQVPDALRLGMTAQVDVVAGGARGALLVPSAAVRQLPDGYAVTLMKADTASGSAIPERRFIQIGRSDGIFTEVVGGLSEGDEIEVRYAASQSPLGGNP